jgi:hypothetical protein
MQGQVLSYRARAKEIRFQTVFCGEVEMDARLLKTGGWRGEMKPTTSINDFNLVR